MKYAGLVAGRSSGPRRRRARCWRRNTAQRESRAGCWSSNPAREEAGKVAESALDPYVHASLLRIARGEFHDAERQRDKDGEQADDPDDDGTGPGAGGDGDPAQAEGGDHVEHDEVAETQHAPGMLCERRASRLDSARGGRLPHWRDCSCYCPGSQTAGSSGRTLRRASSPGFRRGVARWTCRWRSPASGRWPGWLSANWRARSIRARAHARLRASGTTYRSLRIHCRVRFTRGEHRIEVHEPDAPAASCCAKNNTDSALLRRANKKRRAASSFEGLLVELAVSVEQRGDAPDIRGRGLYNSRCRGLRSTFQQGNTTADARVNYYRGNGRRECNGWFAAIFRNGTLVPDFRLRREIGL